MTRTILILRIIATLIRWLGDFLVACPLLALALYFVADNVPHIRVVGGYYGYNYNQTCTYLGSRGFVYANHRPYDCPLLLMMNIHTGAVSQ